jgi:hypothetical protein
VHHAFADEPRDLGRGRSGIDLVGRAHLQEPARRHHRHPVGDRHRLALVMGNVDRGGRRRAVKGDKLFLHRGAQMRIEIGQGFVH